MSTPRPLVEHISFFGSTATGKSTLMRRFSRALTCRQIIYEPTGWPMNWTDGWRPDRKGFFGFMSPPEVCTEIYDRPADWVDAANGATDAALFCDEGADIFYQTAGTHHLITKARHRGNRVFIASQRPTQISPTVRAQCTIAYMFRLAHSDLDACLRDAGFSAKQLARAPQATGEVVTVDCIGGKIHSGFVDLRNEIR